MKDRKEIGQRLALMLQEMATEFLADELDDDSNFDDFFNEIVKVSFANAEEKLLEK